MILTPKIFAPIKIPIGNVPCDHLNHPRAPPLCSADYVIAECYPIPFPKCFSETTPGGRNKGKGSWSDMTLTPKIDFSFVKIRFLGLGHVAQ